MPSTREGGRSANSANCESVSATADDRATKGDYRSFRQVVNGGGLRSFV